MTEKDLKQFIKAMNKTLGHSGNFKKVKRTARLRKLRHEAKHWGVCAAVCVAVHGAFIATGTEELMHHLIGGGH